MKNINLKEFLLGLNFFNNKFLCEEEKKFLKDIIGVLVSAIRHLAGEIVVEQQNAFPRLWEGIRV